MPDNIQLLPDSVANQIAAGEVIQRPASVVKELMENAIDAKSNKISVVIKDAGKTSIQVTDNGIGMSETDARMAFERHATSKITKADDLFAIKSMGFRGEALASIAAIAQVEIKTKPHNADIGTSINVNGAKVEKQEPVNCAAGTSITVKNLFFNVPARRKFLKKDSTELKHIIQQFQRIAISHTNITFALYHNNNEVFNLPQANLKKRLTGIFGDSIGRSLVKVDTETTILRIFGFVGKPELAKKTSGEQYFFVNNRSMRSPYFHKAIMKAYENILPADYIPAYFIFFEISPEEIDVNIHPTKTEINFEKSGAVFQILLAAVKETLGKFNIAPSLDFDSEKSIETPPAAKNTDVSPPGIEIDPNFNPFTEGDNKTAKTGSDFDELSQLNKDNMENWQKLYSEFENEPSGQQNIDTSSGENKDNSFAGENFFQFKKSYILTSIKSGLIILHQRRAHIRILFEQFINMFNNQSEAAQNRLFPETYEVNPEDTALFQELIPHLLPLGFDIAEFGKNTFVINAIPSSFEVKNPTDLLTELLNQYKDTGAIKDDFHEKIALSLSRAAAITVEQGLTPEEMREMFNKLFTSTAPNYTPDGKKIIHIIKTEELHKFFN